MRVMSPRTTLMSWGSETIRVYSKNQPVRVMFRAHLPCAFVRKFSSSKRRPSLLREGCLSKTGPGLSHRIARAIKNIKGAVITKRTNAPAAFQPTVAHLLYRASRPYVAHRHTHLHGTFLNVLRP